MHIRNKEFPWGMLIILFPVFNLTHYWLDDRFPGCKTVTKVGCSNLDKLIAWGKRYDLKKEWIHLDPDYPHFDLFGDTQKKILVAEDKWDHIEKFRL